MAGGWKAPARDASVARPLRAWNNPPQRHREAFSVAVVRFGLIGYGLFGRWHARCLSEISGAELAAICTRSDANVRAAQEAHLNVPIVADWRNLLDDSRIDAVDIVAPNHLHAEMAIAALQAGKHVLVEKPLATSIEDCDRIVAAVRETGGLLSVGHELRFSRQWAPIKRLIDEGAIGMPRYANLTLFRHPYRQGGDGWRYDPDRVGSWILEEPVHFYDLILWYLECLGPPVSVTARATGREGRGMFDNFTSWLAFGNGAYATISQSLAGFGHHLALDLTGDEGAVRSWWSASDARSVEPSFALEVKRARADASERVAVEASGELFELAEEIRRTADAFAEGRTLVSAEEARRAVFVCLEAERSVNENREIALTWS
jgi:myo-inositol 2-dehydrogenase / D-chiro-inositol 1-dehydrogenase